MALHDPESRREAEARRPEEGERGFASRCVHQPMTPVASETPPASPPIFASSVFHAGELDIAERSEAGEGGLYRYSRLANPTVAAFESAVAELEGAEAASAAGSGMGAMASVLLAHLGSGDRVVTAGGLYGTTVTLLNRLGELGVIVEPLSRRGTVPDDTRLVLAETVSNPLLEVPDLSALAAAAREAGALLVVDNTFATPYHCRPLDLGADLVVHSATKFLGGHSDLIAGVVAGGAPALEPVRRAHQVFGATLSAGSAWLALRGMRTLALRMERQAANAAAVAAFLADHASARRVLYPGLPEHPSRAVADRVLRRGHGAMVSFELEGRPEVERLMSRLAMIRFAPSLGDVATTWSHPASTSHRGLSESERAAAGIGPGLVRLSVGVEAVQDILSDLGRGL